MPRLPKPNGKRVLPSVKQMLSNSSKLCRRVPNNFRKMHRLRKLSGKLVHPSVKRMSKQEFNKFSPEPNSFSKMLRLLKLNGKPVLPSARRMQPPPPSRRPRSSRPRCPARRRRLG